MTSILVVEDDKHLLEEFAFLVEAMGYDVLSAADGATAVRLARQQHPDLILCDILMPDMDGYEVLQTIRQDPSTARTPFIFLTARAEQDAYRQGMEFGADDYLTKPCSQEQLERALDTQLRKAQHNEQLIARQVLKQIDQRQSAERAFISDQMNTYIGSILRSIGIVTQNGQSRDQQQRLQQIRKLVDQAVDELNAIAQEIHPEMLEHLGLQAALAWLAERTSQHSGVHLEWSSSKTNDHPVPAYLQRDVYYAVQTLLRCVDTTHHNHRHNMTIATAEDVLRIKISAQPPLLLNNATLTDLQHRLQTHDGTLKTESRATTQHLQISYPLNIMTSPEPRAEQPFEIASHAITVLIYSSNAAAGLSLRTVLRRHTQLRIADIITEPADMQTLLRRNKPDLVILDVDYEGGHLLSLLQQHHVPALLVADRASQAIVQLLRQGATGFLIKRELVHEAHTAIMALLNERIYLGSPLREAAFEAFVDGRGPDKQSVAQLAALTRREQEILQWVVAGHTSAEIAHHLSISPRTVETHRSNMLKKLDVKSKAALIRLAINAGIDGAVDGSN